MEAIVPSTAGSSPGRRAGGTRAVETAARRRRLLEAAVALAAEGGYEAVQMRDVAARAEVALGTLYRHYSSKDQLLLAAMAAQADVLRCRLEQRPPRGNTAAERVSEGLRRACTALERQGTVTSAMVTAMSSTDGDVAPVKQAVQDSLRRMIAGAIGDDIVDDSCDDPVEHLDAIVKVLGAVWFAGLAFWVGGMTKSGAMADDLERAAHLLLDR
ncbi:MAG: TetR/AcrR family transcriptional regulator, cholesterol catabolism regulator [Actinomycetota bacterium]|nr:TetR/AcrR family transcriptional regulator, cholesterol catabolism regulator [Actinomycetota bacterium]